MLHIARLCYEAELTSFTLYRYICPITQTERGFDGIPDNKMRQVDQVRNGFITKASLLASN